MPRRPLEVAPGKYADGAPLDEVHGLECKLILKPDRFTSQKSFWLFAKTVRSVARKCDADFSTAPFDDDRPQIRELVFTDTADFRLYNSAFILQRRVPYLDGFPAGEPELVFKFRHPDLQAAAELDVRPRVAGDYRVRFRAEALPRRKEAGAFRLLFSHSVEFPVSHLQEGDPTSFGTLSRVFPPLATLRRSKGEQLTLLNVEIVEEVLQDIGILDFGKGITARASVSLWRARGDHMPVVGEFAFLIKFKDRKALDPKAMARCEQFFVRLQHAAKDWLLLDATKTGVVLRLKGNPPQPHE